MLAKLNIFFNRTMSDSMTLSAAVDFVSHVDGVPDVKHATIISYRTCVRTVIAGLGYDPRVDEISPQLLYDWSNYLADNMGVISGNSRKRSMRAILNKLHSRGVITRNFSEHIRLKPEPPKSIKAITEENKDLMVDVAPIMWKAAIEVLWATGCRRGGLLSMKRRDFDVWRDGDNRVGTVKVVEKADRPRTVFMREEAIDAIHVWLRYCRPESEYMFCNGDTGEPLCYTTPTNMLRKIAKRAGIPKSQPTSPHSFRHAFALRQLDAGVSPELVADWMGIDVTTLLAHYTIRDTNRLRQLYMERAV